MKRYLIICLPVIWINLHFLSVSAQALSHDPIGGRAVALGNISSVQSDLWSLHNNQAGMALLPAPAAGIWRQNRFLVKELGHNAAGFVLPTGSGVFGAGLQYLGFSLYNETKLGVAYARKFGDKLATGLQLDYFSRHIAEDYGNASAFTFELGLQFFPDESLVIGVHVFNPVQVRYSDDPGDELPAVFSLGLMYRITDELSISAESEKDLNFKPLFRTGIEYSLVVQLVARIGFSTLPGRTGHNGFSVANVFSFGFGYEWKGLSADFSASVHQALGWTPGISVQYAFDQIHP